VPLQADEISFIGGYGSEDRFFTGMMEDFILWNRLLDDNEMLKPESVKAGLLLSFDFGASEGMKIPNLAGDTHALIVEKDKEIPEIPRFGTTISIPGDFSELTWYGRGPHENYCDRNTSAYVGIYKSTVADQYFPYIRPQENGYRTETRWLALQDNTGKGLMIIGEPLVSFSALNFMISDLDQGTKTNYHHLNDLVARDSVFLNVDHKQTGVGGDDSWGARAHPEYTLHYTEYEYSYIIRPLKGNEDLMELSKKRFKLQ
jgi:hypothetical protein